MKRVTGIGGIFLKAGDPKGLAEWYARHLGLPREDWGGILFHWRHADAPETPGTTVWSTFPRDTKYFGSGPQDAMINYRVENLDELLAVLREEGVSIDEKRDDSEYGRFAWITDPEGNRIELWEPPK